MTKTDTRDTSKWFKTRWTHFMKPVCALALATTLVLLAQSALAKNTLPDMPHTTPYIAVISDLHLLSPSLHDDGPAARSMAQSDMKMALQSDSLADALVNRLLLDRPALLLVTGDLTHNGARASHERLVWHLQRLRRAGVNTLVIPGNHDISNPGARDYHGQHTAQVATITRSEFAQLYADFGYGESSERDPHSLSYVCEPLPGLVVLAIDSNRDEENRLRSRGDTTDTYHSGGRIRPETLQWLCRQARQARSRGKRVLAMMHHHLLEHIDGEARFLPNYIIADHEQAARELSQAGVTTVFTGHLHITDAVSDGALTEVATGSASTYPFPLRMCHMSENSDSLLIDTEFGEAWLDKTLLERARHQVEQGAPTIAMMIAGRLWPRVKQQIDQMKPALATRGVDVSRLPTDAQQATSLMMRHLCQPLTESLLSVSCGGEDPAQAPAIMQAINEGIMEVVSEVMPTQAQYMGPFLIENVLPRVEPLMRSALEDRNRVNTPQESSTPDHRLNVGI